MINKDSLFVFTVAFLAVLLIRAISPNENPAVIKATRDAGLISIPAAYTPTEIEAALRACGISGVATGQGADLKLVRKAADRYGKRITKALRQIMEKVVIRRNRLDLLTDPDYAKELSGLSTVKAPCATWCWALTISRPTSTILRRSVP